MTLQGELVGGGEALVFRTDTETATWWGLSRRTVIRHRHAGAPLTRPDQMEAWWLEASGGRRTPGWLLDGMERWKRMQPGAPAPAPEAAEDDVPVVGLSMEILESSDWGIEQQLAIQRGIVQAYAKQLVQLAQRGSDIAAADRRYQAAAKQLQTFEARASKIAIDSGQAWKRAEVEAVVTDIMHAINAGLDYLPVQLRRELGLSREQEVKAKSLVDRLKALWRECQMVPAEVEGRILNDAA